MNIENDFGQKICEVIYEKVRIKNYDIKTSYDKPSTSIESSNKGYFI